MSWQASLALQYAVEAGRTVARFRHDGPLRVLQSLYPEGGETCHNVLVHPPGGLVGGDTLDIDVTVGAGAHGLITTPGATRFYRSEGPPARQRTHLRLEAGARLEWLPLEALAYSGCNASNELSMDLAPDAELLGWDITALGLPHAGQPFVTGRWHQHVELHGAWLERGVIDAADTRLLQSPVGLAGQSCMASIFFVAGAAIERSRRDQALDCAHRHLAQHDIAARAGVTCPNPRVLVLRALCDQVEPATNLLRSVWSAWRQTLWRKAPDPPRIWAM